MLSEAGFGYINGLHFLKAVPDIAVQEAAGDSFRNNRCRAMQQNPCIDTNLL